MRRGLSARLLTVLARRKKFRMANTRVHPAADDAMSRSRPKSDIPKREFIS
jgi:hypothetical protein